MSDAIYHDQQQADAEAGARVTEFLADPAIRTAIVKLEEKALVLFKAAKTDDERRNAQAYSLVVDDFAVLLRATRDRGELAKREIDARRKR